MNKFKSFLKAAFSVLIFTVSSPSYSATVVEYYHAKLDHYFITADATEAAFLDSKTNWGWTRTGYNFDTGGGTAPVCRFYGVFANGTIGSHFYTADPTECAFVKGNVDWGWASEGNAFNIAVPVGGSCLNNGVPVYRAYNDGKGGAANHRITTSLKAIQEVVARGWVNEGVVMCVAAVTYRNTVTHLPNTPYPSYSEANIETRVGEYITNTGVWGFQSAISYTETLSASINPISGVNTMSIDWDIVSSSTPGVVIFGNVTYGKHPGRTTSTTSKIPARLSSLSTLTVSGQEKVVCYTTCVYNSLIDIFVMPTDRSTWTDIGTEIIIHLNGTWLSQWPVDGVTTLGGIQFYVYSGYIGAWKVIMYEPVNNISINSFNFDMKELMNDAVSRNYVKSSDYLVSIELGTEVMSGRGKTEITNYSVQ